MVLAMVLDSAVEDELIKKNPAKSKRLKNPSDKKTERIALTEEQLGDVINSIQRLSHGRDQRYLALLAYTGMRREEVLGLKWTDIDFEHSMIHVERAITFKGNRPVIGKTKTKNAVRDIPLNNDLKRWLTMEGSNKEFVIQDQVSQQIVKRMWERISKEINVYGATPHCFRHSFTTICRRKGMDEKTLQKIGGWSDIETMRSVYTHTQPKDLSIAAEVMNSAFSFEGIAM